MTSTDITGEEFDEELIHGDGVDDCEAEEVYASSDAAGGNANSFEAIMFELEQVMMDESFNAKISAFMTEHCNEFEDTEENKLAYTKLFEEYVGILETYIETRLGAAVPNFDMQAFCAELLKRKDELTLDLDTLGAFGDFEAFKAMMLACKAGKACETQGGGPLCVVGAVAPLHMEDMEEGEEMADLNLSISALSPT
mmetsp:Transcript_46694/g.101458  ORF Transcript_46694/g.101458 Transcript_46694/m.101458 type:complete len:197 (+) Transcript_46694:127-717(+)